MKKNTEIDPAFYENHDFGDDFAEAERNGNLIVPKAGESTIDAIRRHMENNKKVTVSMRLPVGVVNAVKGQAATAGVPWTAYVRAILERTAAEPAAQH